MTSTPPPEPAPAELVAVLGTGLIGTSVAMAASRAGCRVTGWDLDADTLARAAALSGLDPRPRLEDAVADADIVVVATPLGAVAPDGDRGVACGPPCDRDRRRQRQGADRDRRVGHGGGR